MPTTTCAEAVRAASSLALKAVTAVLTGQQTGQQTERRRTPSFSFSRRRCSSFYFLFVTLHSVLSALRHLGAIAMSDAEGSIAMSMAISNPSDCRYQ
jgi:hypothetical protein